MNPDCDDSDSACLFCALPPNGILLENSLAVAINDRYPVTPGHLLVIPKRYVASYFDLVSSELKACNELLHEARSAIRSTDSTVTGFNIGINDGYAAGQTIFHCHIHLIPRRDGDMEQPQGGVRGVISARQHY